MGPNLARIVCMNFLILIYAHLSQSKPSTNHTEYLEMLPKDCGSYSVDPSAFDRVSGGFVSYAGQIPSFVRLTVKEVDHPDSYCGGTIIAPNLVLTAAHCILPYEWRNIHADNPRRYEVHADFHVSKDLQEHRIVDGVCISKYIKGPDYQRDDYKRFVTFDVAILRFNQPIRFNKRVQPACLLRRPVGESEQLYTVGLGLPNNPNGLALNILPQKKFNCNFDESEDIDAKMGLSYCLRYNKPGHVGRACKGDNGSGVFTIRDGKMELVGVIMGAIKNCSEPVKSDKDYNTPVYNFARTQFDLNYIIGKCMFFINRTFVDTS